MSESAKSHPQQAKAAVANMDDRRRGLYEKYQVRRASGDPLPAEAKCFVLRYDTDSCAAIAMLEYAASVASTHPILAADLLAELASCKLFRDDETFRVCLRSTREDLVRQYPDVRDHLAKRESAR